MTLVALTEPSTPCVSLKLSLSCTSFKKKSKRGIETPKPDMDIIRQRLKAAAIVAQELENE